MQVSPEEAKEPETSAVSVKKFAINSTVSDLNVDDAKGADVTQLADRLLGSQKAHEGKQLEIGATGITTKAGVGNVIAADASSAITPRAAPVPSGVHEVTPEEMQVATTSTVSTETDEGAVEVTSSSSSSKIQHSGSSATTMRLPVIGEQLMCREFTMQDQLGGVEITSLDITSHGCYVLAGCGNGMVLLFDLTQKLKEPACVGQILAKGLHTNLLMTVKITEDSRYCFAGVTKGSSELLALDLSRLPIWNEETGIGHCRRPYGFVNELVTCHSRSDPKLRGFGDAVRVRGDRHKATYRLASGLGIKNIHVWQFTPSETASEAPEWTCMYDVATNGNTIESIAFKMGGEYLSSKSAGVNLRVWDLTGYDQSGEANNKPAYEDIANTQDSRALLDDYALGGTYEFAVVNLKAPKAANKDALEVPQRSADDEDGNRRRRMMRQISSISATHDSQHAIVLCADGGCLYFNKSSGKKEDGASGSSGATGATGSLLELPSLPRDMDNLSQCSGRDWALKRVGYQGEVVLLRATQAMGDQPVKVIVRPIYLESMNVPPTILDTPVASDVKGGSKSAWSEWGYFWNPEAAPPLPPQADPVPTPTGKAAPHSSTSAAAVAAPEATTGAKKRGRKEKAASAKPAGEVHDEEESAPKKGAPRGRPPLAPSAVQGTGAKRPRKEASEQRVAAHKASNEEYRKSLQLPSAAAKSSAFGYGYGFGQTGVNPEDCVNDTYEDYAFRFEPEPERVHRPLVIAPPPRARRVVEAPFSRSKYLAASSSSSSEERPACAKPKQPSVANVVMGRFRSLCKHWIQSQTRRPRGGTGEILIAAGGQGGAAEVGVCTLRKLGELGVQQDRVRAQFIGEATRVIAKHLNTLNDSHGGSYLSSPEDISYSQPSQDSIASDLGSAHSSQVAGLGGAAGDLPLGAAVLEIEVVIGRYKGVVRELIQRQQLEIGAAYAMDSMTGPSVLFAAGGAPPRREPQVIFRHGDCWDKTRAFAGTVQLLVNSVMAQFTKEQETVRGGHVGETADEADMVAAMLPTA